MSPLAMRVRSLVVLATALVGLAAQDDPVAAAEALAQKATAEVVNAYHARADALAAQKQHGRALQLRKELVQEWAPGDQQALKALGFVEIGAIWRRDAAIVVLDRDLPGDPKALKKLEQDWQKTQKELVKSVERAAQALTAAGAGERAAVFWRRLLRLKPGDPKATASLQLPTFDGIAGSPHDLGVLRRGRAIAQAVRFLMQYDVPTTHIATAHPLLQKAGLGGSGVATEHFHVYGTLPEDKLQLAAKNAERALLLSRAMFGTAGGRVFEPKRVLDFVVVGDKQAYNRALDACADQFDKDRLAFLKEYVELAFVDVGGKLQRLYVVATGGDDLLLDVTARGVVQDAVGFHTDGLWEGLGHATCCFFFDRTLSFFVEQQKGHTASSWQQKPLVPDMAAWRDMAAESAWAKNDTPTSRLVLLEGARFSNDERVKAWSMVDFLVRERPDLLLQLDAIKTDTVRDQQAVEAAFQQATGQRVQDVDDRWREYWGKGEELRKAAIAEPSGAPADVEQARHLAWAIDAARAAAEVSPAGFVVADDADVKAAHEWVQQLAKWETDRKNPKKKDLPAPTAPVCIGTTVLLHRGTDMAAAVAGWVAQPAVRDWLLHPGRNLFGCSVGKLALALDLTAPAAAVTEGLPRTWPRPGQAIGAGKVAAAALGAPVQAALVAAGVGADDDVGMPVTLHFHRELDEAASKEITCRLFVGGLDRDGVLVPLQGAEGLAAPGCFAFVPKAPLPAGEVEVLWTVPHGLLGKGEVYPRYSFTVQ